MAETPDADVKYWRRYFHLANRHPQWLFQVMVRTPRPGPVNWHSSTGLKVIAGSDA